MTITHREYMDKVVSLLSPKIKASKDEKKYLVAKFYSETGELIGALAKRDFHDKITPNEELMLELGDMTWYLYNLIGLLDIDHQNKIFDSINEIIDIGYQNEDIYDEFNTMFNIVSDIYISPIDHYNSISCLLSIGQIIALIASYLKFDYFEILQANLDKLLKRYNNKWEYDPQFYQSPPEKELAKEEQKLKIQY